MSDKNFKEIRKQLRSVAKDMIPEVLTSEVMKAIHEQLAKDINTRMKSLEDSVKAQMSEINERHKDTMSFLVRQITVPTPPPVESTEPVVKYPKAE